MEALTEGDVPAWDRKVDVVVAGYGIAGACAGIEAHRAGADVLVIERASGGGGASALSGGIFYLGGGTAVQVACGYSDSAEEMYKFMRASTTTPDVDKLKDYCDNSASHFDWLEAQGIPFQRSAFKGKVVTLSTNDGLIVTGNEYAWPSCMQAVPAPRGHQATSDKHEGGAKAMNALLATCAGEALPVLYDSRVTALVRNIDGRIIGVRVRQSTGRLFVRARRGVILATGSFNLNTEMVQEHLPLNAKHGNPLGIPSNDGDGILLGQAVGGALQAMNGVMATASIYPPDQLIKGIIVNNRGERFVAEDVYHGRLAAFVAEQPGQIASLIVDNDIFAYPKANRHQFIDGWESIAEMEAGLGLPEGALTATMERFNKDAEEGVDRHLHKQPQWLKPLTSGPYAAFDISYRSSSYSFIGLGGLRTGLHGEVLDGAGQIIEGLYAAGACSSHLPQTGKEYASGMSLGPGSYFGRKAGRSAAEAHAQR